MPPRPRSRRPLRAVALAVVLGLLAPIAAGAQSLDEVRAERDEIQARLDRAAERLGDLEARIAELHDEAATLEGHRTRLSSTVDRANTRIAERVRDLYKRGIDAPVLHLFNGGTAAEALERAELAQHLVAGDRVVVEEAVAARTRAAAVADQLAQRRASLAAAREDQREALAALETDLARAQELEQRLVAEERRREEQARRQRRAAAERERRAQEAAARARETTRTGGAYACPVGRPHSFTDTWGAPRSGGRRHKGVDILAPRGQQVHAITSGVWDRRSTGRLAGNWAILRGDDGHSYYYMHLQSHVAGDGARVAAGELAAYNGDTGNARGTPHVHFEYHPGRAGAVNPYPLVRRLCR